MISATATPDDTPVPTTISVEGPPTNQFSPTTVTIGVGQSVTWVWAEGAADHNVTPDDAIPEGEAGLFDAPHSYTYTFTQAGTYHYHCSNHGQAGGIGMAGTVVVAPSVVYVVCFWSKWYRRKLPFDCCPAT